MICDICGKEGARIRRINEAYNNGDDQFVIESIPVVSCPHCEKSYFIAVTLLEVERIRLHRSKFARERLLILLHFINMRNRFSGLFQLSEADQFCPDCGIDLSLTNKAHRGEAAN